MSAEKEKKPTWAAAADRFDSYAKRFRRASWLPLLLAEANCVELLQGYSTEQLEAAEVLARSAKRLPLTADAGKALLALIKKHDLELDISEHDAWKIAIALKFKSALKLADLADPDSWAELEKQAISSRKSEKLAHLAALRNLTNHMSRQELLVLAKHPQIVSKLRHSDWEALEEILPAAAEGMSDPKLFGDLKDETSFLEFADAYLAN